MSTITVTACDANGKPMPGQRLILSAHRWTSESDRSADRSRRHGDVHLHRARPERACLDGDDQGDAGQSHGGDRRTSTRDRRIAVHGPSIPFASFTFTPTSPAVSSRHVRRDQHRRSTAAVRQRLHLQLGLRRRLDGTGLVRQHRSRRGVFNVDADGDSPAGTSNSVTTADRHPPSGAPVATSHRRCAVVGDQVLRSTTRSTVGDGATITGHLMGFRRQHERRRRTPAEHDLRGRRHL